MSTTVRHRKKTQTFDRQITREWLLTNGRGGFAAGTMAGVPTRRYHGLLIAAAQPPLERWLFLSSILERVTIGEEAIEFAQFEFEGAFHPKGFSYQTASSLNNISSPPFVQFVFATDDVQLTKWIVLMPDRDEVIVRYRLSTRTPQPLTLELCPLVAMRDFHGLTQRFDPGFAVDRTQGHVAVDAFFEGPRLWMRVDRYDDGLDVTFDQCPDWWRGLVYRVESQRGLEDREDLFVPGWFRVEGDATIDVALRGAADFGGTKLVAPEPVTWSPPVDVDESATEEQRLSRATNAFVVDRLRADGRFSKTILAGYPWFGDWGRDSFIALPGLLLETQRFVEAREVLETFAGALADGLIPNRFDDYGIGCIYNSIDASLWYIYAADAYLNASGDKTAWPDFLEAACESIVNSFNQGTKFNIHADSDELIVCGDEDLQLTWMDAKCDGVVFTPRHGKPVEINALWYHALCVMADRTADDICSERYQRLADQVQKSFVQVFWNKERDCLYDVVRDDHANDAVRPNQILAVSLFYSPLNKTQQKAVLSTVRRELLTPFGLRSLSPNHPAYAGRYSGGRFERDSVYHQGTVWGWLIGPYVEAYLRVHDFSASAKTHMRKQLRHLIAHLDEAGLGSVSEIFDGDPPHTPRGCFAQAWSVAELFRAWRMAAE